MAHKNKITSEDFVKANRCGEYEANKDIIGRMKSDTYKSKKNYSRKSKHKNAI